MRRRGNFHFYENALEAFLIQNNVPFIATDETKRTTYNDSTIKSFDIIIPGKHMLMIDCKGKSFSYKSAPKNNFENWIHQSDADGMMTWKSLSSENQKGYLVYAYSLPDNGEDAPECFKGNTFFHNGRVFAFVAITIEDYLRNSKRRSLKPLALSVSRKLFATLIRPLAEVLQENKI